MVRAPRGAANIAPRYTPGPEVSRMLRTRPVPRTPPALLAAAAGGVRAQPGDSTPERRARLAAAITRAQLSLTEAVVRATRACPGDAVAAWARLSDAAPERVIFQVQVLRAGGSCLVDVDG